MRFFSLIETTVGVLEVETKTVPWIWTLLTFGLLRKAECRISGGALERYRQIKAASSRRFNTTTPSSSDQGWDSEVKVFHTIFCRVAFWHGMTVEYVQAQGGVMSEYRRAIQVLCAIDDAAQDNDVERVLELLKEEDIRSQHALEEWRKRPPF